jgi:mono/diheme cytochrome c family protein
MRRVAPLAAAGLIVAAASLPARAHDVTTRVTWTREVSRIVYARCVSCHRPGGSAFSLLTYQAANPWAHAIKDSVLQRAMPPWGAVKGFGTFRNEQALSQEELGLIENWVNGGAPEGNPNDLPSRAKLPPPAVIEPRSGEIAVHGGYTFPRPFVLDGFRVLDAPKIASARITIEFPDSRIEPLVWLHNYSSKSDHPFLLRAALAIPPGAVVRGVPDGVTLTLLPVQSGR